MSEGLCIVHHWGMHPHMWDHRSWLQRGWKNTSSAMTAWTSKRRPSGGVSFEPRLAKVRTTHLQTPASPTGLTVSYYWHLVVAINPTWDDVGVWRRHMRKNIHTGKHPEVSEVRTCQHEAFRADGKLRVMFTLKRLRGDRGTASGCFHLHFNYTNSRGGWGGAWHHYITETCTVVFGRPGIFIKKKKEVLNSICLMFHLSCLDTMF